MTIRTILCGAFAAIGVSAVFTKQYSIASIAIALSAGIALSTSSSFSSSSSEDDFANTNDKKNNKDSETSKKIIEKVVKEDVSENTNAPPKRHPPTVPVEANIDDVKKAFVGFVTDFSVTRSDIMKGSTSPKGLMPTPKNKKKKWSGDEESSNHKTLQHLDTAELLDVLEPDEPSFRQPSPKRRRPAPPSH